MADKSVCVTRLPEDIADSLEGYSWGLRNGDSPQQIIRELAEYVVQLIHEYEIEWELCFPRYGGAEGNAEARAETR